MNRSVLWFRRGLAICLLCALAFGPAGASGLFPDFFFPGREQPDSGQGTPFGIIPMPGENGQSGAAPETTTLYAMPSARSVHSGDTLTIDYDLALSAADEGRISTIEQGSTLEYTLLYSDPDQSDEVTESLSGSVRFSMNRTENEKCTLTIQPVVSRSSILQVRAKMVFSDGTSLENTSDKILVYTEEEIRSHLYTQACAAGDTVEAVFMVLGPEGAWRFTCYAACSLDGGQTYTRAETPLLTFTLNSREKEPNETVSVIVNAEENCMFRLEADVLLPDGTEMVHATDPVRVSVGAVSL